MKYFTLFALLISFSQITIAQINAVTENGDEVILHHDGKWTYKNKTAAVAKTISTNTLKFVKSSTSTFLVRSTKVGVGIWLNPKKWSFSKQVDNADAEYEFQLKNEDLYGMLISEKIEIPLASLRDIAVENAKSEATNFRVVKEEYRMVNGVKVLMLQMAGTIQGMKIVYMGYYYSDSSGTIQLLTYTGENLFSTYKAQMEALLNGFVKL